MVLGCPRFQETPQYHSLSVSWTTHTDRLHCPSSSLIFRTNNHQNTPRIRKRYRVDPPVSWYKPWYKPWGPGGPVTSLASVSKSLPGIPLPASDHSKSSRKASNEPGQGCGKDQWGISRIYWFYCNGYDPRTYGHLIGWNPLDFRTSPSASKFV
jgi:hypothetical protein